MVLEYRYQMQYAMRFMIPQLKQKCRVYMCMYTKMSFSVHKKMPIQIDYINFTHDWLGSHNITHHLVLFGKNSIFGYWQISMYRYITVYWLGQQRLIHIFLIDWQLKMTNFTVFLQNWKPDMGCNIFYGHRKPLIIRRWF